VSSYPTRPWPNTQSEGPAILLLVRWQDVEPERLFEAVRARGATPDAERTVWAFERALAVARLDPELLQHLLVASVCLVAYEEERSPRAVLEELFRRSVSDGEWRERYEPLLA
jgi:hypothetical protein